MVRIPLFLSSLESGSVRPLMYGKTAKPLSEFEGSAHLKNIPTNSDFCGNKYLDNIQFYYDLLISILFPLKYFYCFLL